MLAGLDSSRSLDQSGSVLNRTIFTKSSSKDSLAREARARRLRRPRVSLGVTGFALG
uniref:Uncharacterized protein n=1 Tax=mine drainage metagenome TaxID=410659 RepID=E6Q8L6_9ZZZZ